LSRPRSSARSGQKGPRKLKLGVLQHIGAKHRVGTQKKSTVSPEGAGEKEGRGGRAGRKTANSSRWARRGSIGKGKRDEEDAQLRYSSPSRLVWVRKNGCERADK